MHHLDENQLNINKLRILCLDRTGTDIEVNIDQNESKTGPKKANKLVCHICGTVITTQHQRISVMGRQVHSKINPAGFAYHFTCYTHAPGCMVAGEPSLDHTWFSGYTWQIASCKQCLEHLGWYFCGDTKFFGLIQGRVIEQDVD